jgi:hypothetical protein
LSSGHIQVGPDGGGKNMDADALVSDETGAPTVYREDVVIADPVTYANKASVTKRTNALKVTPVDDIEGRYGSAVENLLTAILIELSEMREALEELTSWSSPQTLKDYRRKSYNKDWDDLKTIKQ